MLIMEKLVKGQWQVQRSVRSDNPFPGTIQDRSSGTRMIYVFEMTPTCTTISECGPETRDAEIFGKKVVTFQKKTPICELRGGQSHEMTLLTDHTDRRAQYRFRHENE
jgi:hypothetical protein